MVLAIEDDLFFRSKLKAAAVHLGVSLTLAEEVDPAGGPWRRVLIDLNLSRGDALAMVRAVRAAHPSVPVIGYCSHIQQDLQRDALEAGCTQVLPRSAFVRQLAELLKA